MSAPPLLILFVGGCEGLISRDHQLKSDGFLGDLLSSYPAAYLQQPGTLSEFYSHAGRLEMSDGSACSLCTLLEGHDIRQIMIADADRYGFLTEVMKGSEEDLQNIDLRYIDFPPAKTLKDIPQGSLSALISEIARTIDKSNNKVVFAAINSIWTYAGYNDEGLQKKVIDMTQKKILGIVKKALDEDFRILLVLDSLPSADDAEQPQLPCILVHSQIEGLRADKNDIGAGIARSSGPAFSARDIAPTVLSLLGIPYSKDAAGRTLFNDIIKNTFNS